jgi:hypothetical protein
MTIDNRDHPILGLTRVGAVPLYGATRPVSCWFPDTGRPSPYELVGLTKSGFGGEQMESNQRLMYT